MPKKSPTKKRSSIYSPICWTSCATRRATKLRCSSPRKDRNALRANKMRFGIALTRRSETMLCRMWRWTHCLNWLWALNSAGILRTDKMDLKEKIIFAPKYRDMTTLQHCVVTELESCAESTPANLVDAMFKFVRNETPCVNMTVMTKAFTFNVIVFWIHNIFYRQVRAYKVVITPRVISYHFLPLSWHRQLPWQCSADYLSKQETKTSSYSARHQKHLNWWQHKRMR